MPVNADKPHLWKQDIARSVDFYNQWFLAFAPKAYRDTRLDVTQSVQQALIKTENLRNITPQILRENPSVLSMLRMATAPPIARDRLSGLAGVSRRLIEMMEEEGRIPPRMQTANLERALERIGGVILKMADEDVLPWLLTHREPSDIEQARAATIVADRLCGTATNPIIRNAQEKRQLEALKSWFEGRGYQQDMSAQRPKFSQLQLGMFVFRLGVIGNNEDGSRVNIPIDMVVMPLDAKVEDFPLLIEAKSAGDFANTNKRRKEEAVKIAQLRRAYGDKLPYILFLCGYFDSSYLGYEAAEGLDWVWEHRIEDLALLGV